MPNSPPASCGFDFGTSNSSIGKFIAGRPGLVPLQDGRVSIPTAVFFSLDDDATSFGSDATARYLTHEDGRLMRSLKGVLGSSLIHETTQVKRQRVRFLDIISLFIEYVRGLAGEPASVVMGRPVHFVDDDAEADQAAETQLRKACEQAGFATVEFQFEPIAAALAYEQSVSSEQLALVVDIGGGTSDFSIVRVSPQSRGRADRKSDILGFSGIRVGGTDFDRNLDLRTVMPHLGLRSPLRQKNMEPPIWWFHDFATWQRINRMYDPRVASDIRRVRRDALEPEKLDRLLYMIENRKGHALLGSVEEAKIALSTSHAAVIGLPEQFGIEPIEITRSHLSDAVGEFIERIATQLRRTLESSAIVPEAVDAVFLTGGSSRLPLLQDQVRRLFPSAEVIEGDAFGSVATGLTIDAFNRFGF